MSQPNDAAGQPPEQRPLTRQERIEAMVRSGARFTPTATPQLIGPQTNSPRGKAVEQPNMTKTIGSAVMLAAALYPLLVFVICHPMMALDLVSGGSPGEAGEVIALLIGTALSIAIGGFVVALFALAALVPAFASVEICRSMLQWQPPADRYGVWVGATTALILLFLPALSFLEATLFEPGWRPTFRFLSTVEFLTMVIAFGAAIVLGQVGGAIGGVELLRQERRIGIRQEPDEGFGRFRVKQTLALMAILSLVLGALRAVDALRPSVLVILCCWLAAQWLTAPLAIRYARWRVLRRFRQRPNREYLRAQEQLLGQAYERLTPNKEPSGGS